MRPAYARVWLTFLRNSLVREMTFRGNFIIEVVTRTFWFVAQLVLFEIIYSHVDSIRDWTRYEYFAFMATAMLINAIVEALFMPNCANFSELIRTGNLDFALLKPIDTQFLVSFERINLAMVNQVLLSVALLVYSVWHLDVTITTPAVLIYLLLIVVGVAFFYALMIALASTSIWFGRNQSLYDFWFYITVFGRYPREIYRTGGMMGDVLWFGFSYFIPVLLVVTVPARVLLDKIEHPDWPVVLVAPLLTLLGMFLSRRVFQWSLANYRSASS
jgi:viologen exporter family transport system permease protein